MTAPSTGTGAQSGSFLTRKLGPLPMWVWMALVLLALLGLSLWQKNKAAASSTDTTSTSVPDQTPPWIIQNYVTYPGDGSTPPTTPPGGHRPPPTGGGGNPPAGGEKPNPKPKPKPEQPTPQPAPAGQWITVVKYTSSNPPWNSTISGIASHLGWGSNWGAVWNDPQNASLKARRKEPKYIQPGDRVWVPAK